MLNLDSNVETAEPLQLKCGLGGALADFLEQAVIDAKLNDSYAVMLKEKVIKNDNALPWTKEGYTNATLRETFISATTQYIHQHLNGNLDQATRWEIFAPVNENAGYRLNAAAMTIDAAENKEDILAKIDITPEQLELYKTAKVKPPSFFQWVNDVVDITGYHGPERKQEAEKNNYGMSRLYENAVFHCSKSPSLVRNIENPVTLKWSLL